MARAQAAWRRIAGPASGASPGRRRARRAASASPGPEGASTAGRCPAPGLQRLVRGPASAAAAAGAGADREPERVPRRGAQRVLRQDVLVREQRDGLRAVRADHPVHLEGVVRVELVVEASGSTPSGSGSTTGWCRLGAVRPGRLRLCMGFSPSGGPTRRCGLDHSKHFPSRLGGNHETITDTVRGAVAFVTCRCSATDAPASRAPAHHEPGMTWAAQVSEEIRRTVGSRAMEELDRQIVELLVKDGRMSYTDLGKATGLSTSAVHQRVRRLEQRGVIRGYAAVVDPEAVGCRSPPSSRSNPSTPARRTTSPTGSPRSPRSRRATASRATRTTSSRCGSPPR